MRFSVAAVLALASAVLAQTPGFDVVAQPTKDESVPAGTTYEIKWEPTEEHGGTVSIILLGGDSDKTLQILETIAEGVDNTEGTYTWAVDNTLGTKATYGLQLVWDEDPTVFQWSFPFKIVGASVSVSSTASSVVSSSSFAPNSTFATSTAPTSLISSTAVSTPPSNLSTTRSPTQTTVSLTASSSPSSTSTSTSTTKSSSGATAFTGSTLALFGGIAMAVFAL